MTELERLRKRVIQERRRGCGRDGKPYSTKLRQDASAYLQDARAKGQSPNQVGPAMGLSIPTAYEWSSKSAVQGKSKVGRSSKAFRQMKIVSQTETRPRGDGADVANRIVVTGPGGLQASGLGVTELAELLRRLGC